MTEKVKSGATYEDVIEAPPDRIAEMADGDLYLSPRPSLRHASVSSVLGAMLNRNFHRRGAGGWWILDEPELHLRGDVLVPDIAGWRRERLPDLPNEAAMTQSPDWACEILSPSTELFDRHGKLPRYALASVNHVWLVDVGGKRLEVYALQGDQLVLTETHSGATTIAAPPFESRPIDLDEIWD